MAAGKKQSWILAAVPLHLKKRKEKQNCQKKYSLFKGDTFYIFKQSNTFFFCKMFYYFFIAFIKILLQPFLDFYTTKRTICQKQLLVIIKYFNIGLKKNVSLNVSPKNCFLEPNFIQKQTKTKNFL